MTILCEPDQRAASALIPSLDGAVHTVPSLPDVAMTMVAEPDKKLVVIGPALGFEDVLSFARQVRTERPEVAVILLRARIDPVTLTAAHEAGVRDVVSATDASGLARACERARGDARAPSVPPPTPSIEGRIVTVFSAKGGCGKTTLATNLAVVLNAGGSRRVCLIDLDLAFGDVAISLQLTPSRTLIDALGMDGRFRGELDGAELDAILTPFSPGLDCILAPVGPGDAEKVPAAMVTVVLDALRHRYDYIVVDTPSQFSEHVLAALDVSHHHVLLAAPEIPALKNLRLTLDMLDLLSFARESRAVVLNRCDAQVGLSPEDVAAAIKSDIDAQVPSSRDVPVSINRGVPLAHANPDHPVSNAIRDFAQRDIVGQIVKPKRRFGLGSRRRTQSA